MCSCDCRKSARGEPAAAPYGSEAHFFSGTVLICCFALISLVPCLLAYYRTVGESSRCNSDDDFCVPKQEMATAAINFEVDDYPPPDHKSITTTMARANEELE